MTRQAKNDKFTYAQWKIAWDRFFSAGKQLRQMARANGDEITVDIKVKTGALRKKK